MKKFITVLVIIINYSFIINNCQSQWVPSYGTTLSNEYIYSMTSIGNNLFAAPANGYISGAYISTNNGLSWNSAGLSSDFVPSITASGNNLFAGLYNSGGVYISTNYGTNWTLTSSTNIDINTLFVNGLNLYAGCWDGIYCTSNNGVNWTYISSGLPFNPFPNVWAINSLGPYLFAGTRYGIYRTSDNGTNWTPTSVSKWVRAFAIIGTYLFAGTDSNLYRSSDNGDTWINVSNGLPDLHVRSLIANGTYLFAGTDANLCRSSDNGASWTVVNKGLKNLQARCFTKIGTNIFAGFSNSSYGGGVYLTTNNGDYWTKLDFASQCANTLVTKENNIFASTGNEGIACNGIFLSTNNGNNWITVNNGLTNLYVRSLTVCDSNIFAGTYGDGVFISSNNGSNWSAVNTGLSNLYVRSLATNGTNIFAGTDSAGVFRSTNKGENWSAVNNGLAIKPFRCLGVNSPNIYAGSDSGRVYLSTNNGEVWTLINNGISNNVIVVCFAFSGNTIYTGTNEGTNGGIYVSTNNGGNWTLLRGSEVNSITTSGTSIVIGTYNGVFLSSNNGITWQDKNQGFQYSYPIAYSLLIKNNYTFVGMGSYNMFSGISYNSVWRRELWELLDVKNISSKTPLSYSLSQNYPNPFNPTTKIKFDIMRLGDVKIIVYDITGREIQALVNEKLSPGTYEVSFDGSQLTSGVYFYKLITGGFTETKKMILIK